MGLIRNRRDKKQDAAEAAEALALHERAARLVDTHGVVLGAAEAELNAALAELRTKATPERQQRVAEAQRRVAEAKRRLEESRQGSLVG
jgi:hypothetical protein